MRAIRIPAIIAKDLGKLAVNVAYDAAGTAWGGFPLLGLVVFDFDSSSAGLDLPFRFFVVCGLFGVTLSGIFWWTGVYCWRQKSRAFLKKWWQSVKERATQ